MSQQLISLNPDLKQLRDEGFEVELQHSYLLVHGVPYVNASRQVARGTLVSALTLAGDRTARPADHTVWFVGEHPCNSSGQQIAGIKLSSQPTQLAPGLLVQHQFSNKPSDGYGDYYEKMTRYIQIISDQARVIEPSADARTFKPIEDAATTGAFRYLDTASSRAGIGALTPKLVLPRVAIVGLGGTGSYVLDLLAKTPVAEIHLFDGDRFLQHNAFRAPGAPTLQDLETQPSKVTYFEHIYSHMHRGIVAHEMFITPENAQQLCEFSFVFVCMDNGPGKKAVLEALQSSAVPFIDVGIGVQLNPDRDALLATCRVTTSTPERRGHVLTRIGSGGDQGDDEYRSNIQIADLNALNAALAVIKWKKLLGFYDDLEGEHHSTYTTSMNLLTTDEVS